MKKFILAIGASVALTGAALAAGPIDTSKHRQVVNEMLSEKGVRARNVERIAIEPMHSGQDDVIKGVLAMVWVDSCADGYLVVRMTNAGVVKSAYTRGGCKLNNFSMQ